MIRTSIRLPACVALAVVASYPLLAPAQEKKTDADKGPRVILASPLAVAPGTTTTIKVRGLKLSDATDVRLAGARDSKAAIKSKGKADVPAGAEAAAVGDTQVEIELSVPPDAPPGELPLVVATPSGETKPYELTVVVAKSLVQEKEPNDGFRQAQEVTVSKTVAGTIQGGEDVDVFQFEGKSGQTLVAEVVAARRGSALDSLLTLYDAAGHVLSTNDDAGEGEAGEDSVLRFKCPSDGTYFLALTDANARGGASTHPYLLALKAAE